MGPHQSSVEGKENLPLPAGHTLVWETKALRCLNILELASQTICFGVKKKPLLAAFFSFSFRPVQQLWSPFMGGPAGAGALQGPCSLHSCCCCGLVLVLVMIRWWWTPLNFPTGASRPAAVPGRSSLGSWLVSLQGLDPVPAGFGHPLHSWTAVASLTARAGSVCAKRGA